MQDSYSYETPTALGWHLLVMNREEDDVSVIVLELPKASEQKPSLTINDKPYSDEVIGTFERNKDNSVVVLHQQLQSQVPLIRLDLSVH